MGSASTEPRVGDAREVNICGHDICARAWSEPPGHLAERFGETAHDGDVVRAGAEQLGSGVASAIQASQLCLLVEANRAPDGQLFFKHCHLAGHTLWDQPDRCRVQVVEALEGRELVAGYIGGQPGRLRSIRRIVEQSGQ
jgi:hypothetical protein